MNYPEEKRQRSQASNRLMPIPRRLLAIGWILIIMSAAGIAADRSYTLVTAKEARTIIESAINNRLFPTPLASILEPGYWKPPNSIWEASGVRIEGKEHLLYAPVESAGQYFSRVLSVAQLSKVLSALKGIALENYKDDSDFTFSVNGILMSTVDLEVIAPKPTIILKSGSNGPPGKEQWLTTPQVLKKGFYIWYICPFGVLVSASGKQEGELFLPFSKPIVNYLSLNSGITIRYLVDFTIGSNPARILVRVEDNLIELR